MFQIESKLLDWEVNEYDRYVGFIFANDKNLVLRDHHAQECFENVAVDWDEIPEQVLDELIGLHITSFEMKAEPKGEGGFQLIFNHTPIEDPKLPEEFWINRKSILVGCHNWQNGYYSSTLSVTATYSGVILGFCTDDEGLYFSSEKNTNDD
jgi:hypothetical protein